ncbi:hypothetical protein GHT06_018628 [Daphnia sinensis]|uniref:Uncharacterized protein n=1 Tax=Daphnia sinensis TaxID=1820382 RepID=A0AAD5L4U2_9CRUS|nr:hypothetical protein GHT06_018628 [Daphnia sinensis]
MANVGNSALEMRSIAKESHGKNWSSWRFGVFLLLEKNRLLRVVLRQEIRPAQQVSSRVVGRIPTGNNLREKSSGDN